MGNLYHDLAAVYEAMYHSFIDYKDEFLFYGGLLEKYNKKNLLEIGSGTGSLAKYFLSSNFVYTGLDYSIDMINIAKTKHPDAVFLNGDMRNFKLDNAKDSAIITGRTISYLLKNKDVNAAFSSIHKNLQPGGILCFDFIDANEFIPTIKAGKTITHEAHFENINYTRKSFWQLSMDEGMTFQWNATYYKQATKGLLKIGTDCSKIRTFTRNEIEIFLKINLFEIKEIIKRPAYAFPTLVVVAERII